MAFAVGGQPNFLPILGGIAGKIIGGISAISGVKSAIDAAKGEGRRVVPISGTSGRAVAETPPIATAGIGGAIGRLPGTIGRTPIGQRIGQVITGGTIAAGVGGLITGSGRTEGQIAPILAKARANTGAPVTSKKIAGVIRQFGFEAASEFFGLNLQELATIWMHVSRRRSRRFTTKDKRRAKAYINYLKRQEKELNSLRPPRKRTYRRRAPASTKIVQAR